MPLVAPSVPVLAAACALALLVAPPSQDPQVGYTDTPLLPGGKWRVHDAARPAPPVVAPGAGAEPPSDAIVLFAGKSLDAFVGAGGKPAAWKLEGGFCEANGSGDLLTKEAFGDCQLHLEFQTPSPPKGESQGRGNSGVFLM